MARSLLPPHVEDYLFRIQRKEDPLLERLRAETSLLEEAGMQIGPDQGRWMTSMVRLINARRCLEVGTFTGYSALCVARALPADGKLVCCDVSEEWTAVARRYWEEAGVLQKIDLRIAPAEETLQQLKKTVGEDTFDFAFIDADKSHYREYYESCLSLVRVGGVILLDNMLWSGRVADEDDDDADSSALRDLNKFLRTDQRVDSTLLSIGDGVQFVVKR